MFTSNSILFLLMMQIVSITPTDFPANPVNKTGYLLDFNESFTGKQIDTSQWIAYYLPQWSSKKMAAPEYELQNNTLLLKIEKDQLPWCPEFNGAVKCSSIQTGLYAGKLGSAKGQHRFNAACIVREEQVATKLYTPQYGYFEIRAKAVLSKNNVVAFWMIGFEDTPDKSGEICIMEVKGENIGKSKSVNGYGVRKFDDPHLTNEFSEEVFDTDATKYNIYAAEWFPDKIDFFINNKKVRTIHQSPNYEMQFMLNIYEIPIAGKLTANERTYPKKFEIDYIRGYKKKSGY